MKDDEMEAKVKESEQTIRLFNEAGSRLKQVEYTTFDEYKDNLIELSKTCYDVVVLAAAVSDYGVDKFDGKISSQGDQTLHLKPLDKVIDMVGRIFVGAQVVGFKLLAGSNAEELEAAAKKVLAHPGVVLCVGNDIREMRGGHHRVTYFYKDTKRHTAYDEGNIAHSIANEIECLCSIRPKILLGVSGSVAAILINQLINFLKVIGDVKVVVTDAAMKIIYPMGFTDGEEWLWMGKGDDILHIELRKWADVFVIAPCSANTLSKLATGQCDNLLTSVARAWDFKKPMIVAPAMNTCMWEHPATDAALAQLMEDGVYVIHPVEKKLACGDIGIGGLADIGAICKEVERVVNV